MKDYQQRVIEELGGLEARIHKLDAFIWSAPFKQSDRFAACDSETRGNLLMQSSVMKAYATILGVRISTFK